MDIHEKYITGTAMRKDGEIVFGGTFPIRKKSRVFLAVYQVRS